MLSSILQYNYQTKVNYTLVCVKAAGLDLQLIMLGYVNLQRWGMYAFKHHRQASVLSRKSLHNLTQYVSHINSILHFSSLCSLRFSEFAQLGVSFFQNKPNNIYLRITGFLILMISLHRDCHKDKAKRPL